MDELAKYVDPGSLPGILLAAITVIAAIVVSIEKLFGWIGKHLNTWYKKKRGKEIRETQLDNHAEEIKQLSESINSLINVTNEQYVTLNKNIDEQNERLYSIDAEGKRRDCAVLRDRILGGMRYFSQNKDENGIVHISMADFENMNHLFDEYESAGGNGTIKHLKEMQFNTFIIDNEAFDNNKY